MVPKVAHGTERVNMIKDFKVLLASKGLKEGVILQTFRRNQFQGWVKRGLF
jgi:hypothetical protein